MRPVRARGTELIMWRMIAQQSTENRPFESHNCINKRHVKLHKLIEIERLAK